MKVIKVVGDLQCHFFLFTLTFDRVGVCGVSDKSAVNMERGVLPNVNPVKIILIDKCELKTIYYHLICSEVETEQNFIGQTVYKYTVSVVPSPSGSHSNQPQSRVSPGSMHDAVVSNTEHEAHTMESYASLVDGLQVDELGKATVTQPGLSVVAQVRLKESDFGSITGYEVKDVECDDNASVSYASLLDGLMIKESDLQSTEPNNNIVLGIQQMKLNDILETEEIPCRMQTHPTDQDSVASDVVITAFNGKPTFHHQQRQSDPVLYIRCKSSEPTFPPPRHRSIS